MAVVGGKQYSNHTKNLNHVYKYTKDMVSVIITVGKHISGGDTVFYHGVKTSDLGSRSHILKHFYGRMIFGPYEKVFHEGTLWGGYRAIFTLSSQNKSSPIFFAMEIGFITDI